MTIFLEMIISLLVLLGAIVMLIGSIGLAKFPDFFTRLHAPTKASTLGVGCILLASLLFFWIEQGYPSFKELLISMFLLITAPVAAHMLAKTGLHYKVAMKNNTQKQNLAKQAYLHKHPNEP
ncbi:MULTISPECIES: Na+/H+ antiporter subunit G [unclassified Agarivorans]|uniref:Na+/H+ antiporter subunit G n=1 Tax=unclassified Agarivorans TaxID=2636026 RepID=UPI003D7C6FD8